jgi:hypothetical protein
MHDSRGEGLVRGTSAEPSASSKVIEDQAGASTAVVPSSAGRSPRAAGRSTGPRTRTGRARSRWNALRHGILAQVTPISEGDGREDVLRFQHFLTQLRHDIQPGTAIEELLAERVASCYWRLGRVVRAETAAIQAQIEDAGGASDADDAQRRLELDDEDVGVEATDRLRDVIGVDSVLEIVRAAAAEIEGTGFLDEGQMERFREVVGRAPWTMAQPAERLSRAADRERKEGARAELADLEDELQAVRKQLVEEDRRALKRIPQRLAVPDEATANRLLRYETAIERQLFRAIQELDRLQTSRAQGRLPTRLRLELES